MGKFKDSIHDIILGEKISDNIYLDNNGQLICENVVLARTGNYDYREDELLENGSPEKIVQVYRSPEEVFDEESIKSMNYKPLVDEHPEDNVTPETVGELQKGFMTNVRRGVGEFSNCLMADLVITDPYVIELVRSGKKRELSVGYTADILEENGQYVMKNIRGNHIALCEAGRAGNARIRDSKTVNDSFYVIMNRARDVRICSDFQEAKKSQQNSAMYKGCDIYEVKSNIELYKSLMAKFGQGDVRDELFGDIRRGRATLVDAGGYEVWIFEKGNPFKGHALDVFKTVQEARNYINKGDWKKRLRNPSDTVEIVKNGTVIDSNTVVEAKGSFNSLEELKKHYAGATVNKADGKCEVVLKNGVKLLYSCLDGDKDGKLLFIRKLNDAKVKPADEVVAEEKYLKGSEDMVADADYLESLREMVRYEQPNTKAELKKVYKEWIAKEHHGVGYQDEFLKICKEFNIEDAELLDPACETENDLKDSNNPIVKQVKKELENLGFDFVREGKGLTGSIGQIYELNTQRGFSESEFHRLMERVDKITDKHDFITYNGALTEKGVSLTVSFHTIKDSELPDPADEKELDRTHFIPDSIFADANMSGRWVWFNYDEVKGKSLIQKIAEKYKRNYREDVNITRLEKHYVPGKKELEIHVFAKDMDDGSDGFWAVVSCSENEAKTLRDSIEENKELEKIYKDSLRPFRVSVGGRKFDTMATSFADAVQKVKSTLRDGNANFVGSIGELAYMFPARKFKTILNPGVVAHFGHKDHNTGFVTYTKVRKKDGAIFKWNYYPNKNEVTPVSYFNGKEVFELHNIGEVKAHLNDSISDAEPIAKKIYEVIVVKNGESDSIFVEASNESNAKKMVGRKYGKIVEVNLATWREEGSADLIGDSDTARINDVHPNEGESKEDFISRFMSETKEEYPDKDQRLAVAYAYWKKGVKDSKEGRFAILHPTRYEFLSVGARSWVKEDSTNIQKFSSYDEALEFGRKYVDHQFRITEFFDSKLKDSKVVIPRSVALRLDDIEIDPHWYESRYNLDFDLNDHYLIVSGSRNNIKRFLEDFDMREYKIRDSKFSDHDSSEMGEEVENAPKEFQLREYVGDLIDDEVEAVKGYDKTLLRTDLDESTRAVLEEIRNEELDHTDKLNAIYKSLTTDSKQVEDDMYGLVKEPEFRYFMVTVLEKSAKWGDEEVSYFVRAKNESEARKKVGGNVVRIVEGSYSEYLKFKRNGQVIDAGMVGYLFPKLNRNDLLVAYKYGLGLGAINPFKGEEGTFLLGSLENIKKYAKDYLGYELVKGYLVKGESLTGN